MRGLGGAVVKVSEATLAPPSPLIERLRDATDCPREEGHKRGKRSAVPRLFATWAKSAWADLIRELLEEEDAAHNSDAAREEFAGQIAAVLHTIMPFGTHIQAGHETKVERRSLINFCELWAKPTWGQIRSLNLWCRRVAGVLEVALRRELFAQINRSELAKLSATKLTQLCERYKIGRGTIVLGRRAIVLEAAFTAEHVAGKRLDAATGKAVGNPDADSGKTVANDPPTTDHNNRKNDAHDEQDRQP
jgi:hypothetical protein